MRIRGFEKISYQEYLKTYQENDIKYQDLVLPTRKTTSSAGYDLVCPKTITLKPNQLVVVPTGIKAYMQDDEVLMLYVRSSLGFKKRIGLVNQTAIIDSDYYNNPQNEGHIMIGLVNLNDQEVNILAGDLIVQGVFTKYLKVDQDQTMIKRLGGIGSTDDKISNC